jgi:hypothetical protein
LRVTTATDDNQTHGLQWRVKQGYAQIETLTRLRNELQDKAMNCKSQSTMFRRSEEAEAIWIGLCRIRDDLAEEFKLGRQVGLLPVLWSDAPTLTNSIFWPHRYAR